MVLILASVTLAINVGQATSDGVTVSFTYFLFNLVTFGIIQLQQFYNYNYCNNDKRGQREAEGETELLGPKEVLLLFLSGSHGKGFSRKADLLHLRKRCYREKL